MTPVDEESSWLQWLSTECQNRLVDCVIDLHFMDVLLMNGSIVHDVIRIERLIRLSGLNHPKFHDTWRFA